MNFLFSFLVLGVRPDPRDPAALAAATDNPMNGLDFYNNAPLFSANICQLYLYI